MGIRLQAAGFLLVCRLNSVSKSWSRTAMSRLRMVLASTAATRWPLLATCVPMQVLATRLPLLATRWPVSRTVSWARSLSLVWVVPIVRFTSRLHSARMAALASPSGQLLEQKKNIEE